MSPAFLIVPVLLPIAGGALLPLLGLPEKKRNLCLEILVLLTSVSAISCVLFLRGETLVLFHLTGNLSFALRLDGLGCVFTSLVAALWPLSTLYAFEYMRHEERTTSFFASYTMTYGVTLGIAMASDIVTMYLFYELLTLVSVYLVMHPMTKKALKASRTYLYYSIGGAAFAFLAMVFLILYGNTTQFTLGGVLNMEKIGSYGQLFLLLYVLAFFGFGVKAAIFPFQAWLPQASVAPTPVTALLHAVAVVKAGAFAVLRLTYYCFGADFIRGSFAHVLVMTAAMISIIYASTMAVKETHFKRRLAFSTVSNLSYVLLAATMMSTAGLFAAMLHTIMHAVMKIGAFFCYGAFYHQSGRQYIDEINGIGKRMPLTFGVLIVFSCSLVGIPLFGGFISKWNIAMAIMDAGKSLPYAFVAGGVLLYSALMTAIYMFTLVVRAWFPDKGSEYAPNEAITDPNWEMKLPLLLFAAFILLGGLYSAPLNAVLHQIAGGVF